MMDSKTYVRTDVDLINNGEIINATVFLNILGGIKNVENVPTAQSQQESKRHVLAQVQQPTIIRKATNVFNV